MSSLLLGQVANALPPSLDRIVCQPIMQATDLIPMIPHKGTNNQFHLTRLQDVSVPTPSWRQFNQAAPNPTRGTQRVETRWAGQLDFVIKVDMSLARMPSQWRENRAEQIRLHGIGAGFELQRVWFNGNHNATPAEPDGFFQIVTDGILRGFIPSAQKVSLATGGGTLAFSNLDQASTVCYGDNRKWLMNRTMERKILALARDASTTGILRISDSRDMLGRKFKEYDGMPILPIERKDDHSTELGFTFNDGSGNLDTTQILLVNFSTTEQGMYSFGPDSNIVRAEPFLRLPGTPFEVSYTSLAIGFMLTGPTGFAVVNQINNA